MRGLLFRRAVVAATLVIGATAAQPASAQLSQLNLVGSTKVYQVLPGAANNLVVDFLPLGGGNGVVQTSAFVGDQTGVFSFLPPGFPGHNIDFVFGTAVSPTPTSLPTPVLTIGGFTFTGTAFGTGNTGTPVFLQYDPFTNTTNASLTLLGTVVGPGLGSPRGFTGSYTTQFPGITPAALINQIQNGTVLQKSISATFVLSAVPEPATLALVGSGLLALVGVVRRRRMEA